MLAWGDDCPTEIYLSHGNNGNDGNTDERDKGISTEDSWYSFEALLKVYFQDAS